MSKTVQSAIKEIAKKAKIYSQTHRTVRLAFPCMATDKTKLLGLLPRELDVAVEFNGPPIRNGAFNTDSIMFGVNDNKIKLMYAQRKKSFTQLRPYGGVWLKGVFVKVRLRFVRSLGETELGFLVIPSCILFIAEAKVSHDRLLDMFPTEGIRFYEAVVPVELLGDGVETLIEFVVLGAEDEEWLTNAESSTSPNHIVSVFPAAAAARNRESQEEPMDVEPIAPAPIPAPVSTSAIATRSQKKAPEPEAEPEPEPEPEPKAKPASAPAVMELDTHLLETCGDPKLRESIANIQRQMAELERKREELHQQQLQALEQCKKQERMLRDFEHMSLHSWMQCVGRGDKAKFDMLKKQIECYTKLHWTDIERMASDGSVIGDKKVQFLRVFFVDETVLSLYITKKANGRSQMGVMLRYPNGEPKNIAEISLDNHRGELTMPLFFLNLHAYDRMVTTDFSTFCNRAVATKKCPSFSALVEFFEDVSSLLQALMLLYVAGPDINDLFEMDLTRLRKGASQDEAEEMVDQLKNLQPACCCCIKIAYAHFTLYGKSSAEGSPVPDVLPDECPTREHLALARYKGGVLDPVGFFRYCSRMFTQEERELVSLLCDLWQLTSMEAKDPGREILRRRTMSVGDRHNMSAIYLLFYLTTPAYTSVLGKRKQSDVDGLLLNQRRKVAALLLQDFGLVNQRFLREKERSGSRSPSPSGSGSDSDSSPPPPAKKRKISEVSLDDEEEEEQV